MTKAGKRTALVVGGVAALLAAGVGIYLVTRPSTAAASTPARPAPPIPSTPTTPATPAPSNQQPSNSNNGGGTPSDNGGGSDNPFPSTSDITDTVNNFLS